MAFAQACDCATGSNSQDTPLCQKNRGTYTNEQLFGKAYPSIREIGIARAMAQSPVGVQGVVSSLCPIHTTFANGNRGDPQFGYRPALGAILNRLKAGFVTGCLSQPLLVGGGSTGHCNVLVTLAQQTAGGESACSGLPGLSIPSTNLLQSFQAAQHQQWLARGGAGPDPSAAPSCLLQQLTPTANPTDFQNGTCTASTDPGWCYAGATISGTCQELIAFSSNEPPPGTTASVFCGN
jgi:hypothetical protein